MVSVAFMESVFSVICLRCVLWFAASVTLKITICGVCMGCTPSITKSKRSYSTCVLVAQSVEHLTFNQVVEGSIPSKHIYRMCYGIKSYIEMHQRVTMYSFQILIFTLDTVYLLTLYLNFIKKKITSIS